DAQVTVVGEHLDRHLFARGGHVRVEGLSGDHLLVWAEREDSCAGPVEVQLRERVTDVALDLEPSGTLEVEVRDDHGAPVPFAEGSLGLPEGQVLIRARAKDGKSVRLGPLAPGAYELRASGPELDPVVLPIRMSRGRSTFSLALHRATSITGWVTDSLGRR